MTDKQPTQTEQLRDESRSYRELLLESAINHRRFLWIVPALVFGFLTMITLSFIVHLHLMEISVVASAEQQSENTVTDIPAIGLYLSAIIYATGFLAATRGFVYRGEDNV